MSEIDYYKVESAIEEYNSNFIDALVESAGSVFIFSSIFAYAKLIKRKIVPELIYDTIPRAEIDELLKVKAPRFSKSQIDALVPVLKDIAPESYTDKYRDELMKGGRTIAIGKWSEPDDLGQRNYLGYEKRWVPWLKQKTEADRELIYSTLTSGKGRDEIAKDLETVFGQRRVYNNLVARTETLNNARIITNDRWKKEGIKKFLYVCSSQPGSPCEDLCAQFCGNIYDIDNLPFGGELSHANCRCSYSALVSDYTPQSWSDLPVAESSDYFRDVQSNDIPNALKLVNIT